MPDQMRQWLEEFPQQIRKAAELGTKWDLDCSGKPAGITFLGIGGSAIGATLVSDLYADHFTCPVVVQRGDTPPTWLEPGCLAVAVSYSGETKETLAAFRKALKAGASGATISSGGSLSQYAEDHHQKALIIPSGMAPRAALGFTSIPLIYLLKKTGAIACNLPDIEHLAKILERLRVEWSSDTGVGSGIAQRLRRRLPIIVGGGLAANVARRFQAQLAENSKTLAVTFEIPEALHNLVETLGRSDLEAFRPIAVFLEDPQASADLKKLQDLLREEFQNAGIEVAVIPAEGDDPIERMYSLIHKVDWVSYHLAAIRSVDAVDIPVISRIKKRSSE